MDSYSELANCYDLFMDDVPYDSWLEFILDRFEYYKVPKELVLDLGCGTGILTQKLADRGYDMIGIDSSYQMLDVALERKDKSDKDILYLCQDIREFELYGTVKAIVCTCDTINYVLEDSEIIETFRLVNNYLDPGGIFIFDFNTVYKYEQIIGDTTIAENRDDYSFIWENYIDVETHINEYDVTIFTREGELFRRSEETHYQRGYTVEEMLSFIQKAGLIFLQMRDEQTHDAVTSTTQRVQIIARENGKN